MAKDLLPKQNQKQWLLQVSNQSEEYGKKQWKG